MRLLQRQDLKGLKFNRLLVLEKAPDRFFGKQKYGWACWNCLCDCGKEIVAVGSLVKTGKLKSCGCAFFDAVKTHGESSIKRTVEYTTWIGIKQRCYNQNANHFDKYGGRGIKVCDRWLQSVGDFIKDMGRRPSKKHSIERINKDGDYEPSNCIWATSDVQQNNKSNNVRFELDGENLTLAQWALKSGLYPETISDRLRRGMSFEAAIKTPIDTRKQRFKNERS